MKANGPQCMRILSWWLDALYPLPPVEVHVGQQWGSLDGQSGVLMHNTSLSTHRQIGGELLQGVEVRRRTQA